MHELKAIAVILIFTSLSTYSACYNNELDRFFDNKYISLVAQCASHEAQYTNIDKFCTCSALVNTNKSEEDKYMDDHNDFIATEFQKNITKALYSISNDLNILDGKLGSDEEFDLFNSCNTNKLDEIAQECGEKDNSFLSLLGVDKIKKLKVQFKTELSKRNLPHINTENSCHEDPKGYVNRCSPEAKSSCNMSDNVADAIFMDTSIRDLTRTLIGFNKLNSSSLDESDKFYNQLDSADQTGMMAALRNLGLHLSE